jgi:phosphatidylethanolamine/phosphatidyl-N-methylethanolamine N-methyltransferase
MLNSAHFAPLPMKKANHARHGLHGQLAFLRGFLKHPRQVGSLIPSSRFLERRVVELGAVRSARTIVELGPGTGGTTRAILRAMRPDAKLLCIEINPEFHAFLRHIDDPRLMLLLGSAEELPQALATYGLPAPDTVISGIPFSTISRPLARRILNSISETLAPGGHFVAYQVRDRVHGLCRPYLGPARVEIELLNIPPVRVFQWQKNGKPLELR